MSGNGAITDHARTLALRLRLGLIDLQFIEQWADESILRDGAPPEIADLCLASRAGERITLRILTDIGGPPGGLDVMQAVSAVRVDDASQDELRRLADNLDPVLREVDAGPGLPPLLKSALTLARDFWEARMHSSEEMEHVEARMRDLLHAVKDYASERPSEKPAVTRPEVHTVSAIVVTYNTGDCLFECLAALEGDAGVAEIILVNNGNPIETLERINDAYGKASKVKVIGGGQNRGFAAGINLGVATASGDRLLVINPDAVLQPGSIAAFEFAMARAAEPAIVGGKIVGTDGVEQRGGRRRRLTMRSAAATFFGLSWLRALNPAFVSINRNTEPEPAGPVPMDAVSGALMYMSASSFRRLGGFDEGYFLHVEDLDLCRRAEADGGSVIYTPHASVLHFGATSDAPSLFVERHKGAGFNRYFHKYAETPSEKVVAWMLGPAIAVLLVMRARVKGLGARKP